MRRYRSTAAVIGYLLGAAILGTLLAVVAYVLWEQVLGLDGQHFVITIATIFVVPTFVVCLAISAAALGFALVRDRTRGAL